MDIVLNGRQHPLERPMSVAELIHTLGFAGKRVAVERNAEIVPRSQHACTALAEGDRVEIVVAVGGG